MRRQLSSAALAVPLVLALLAGCTPSNAKPSPGTQSPTANQEERRLQFTQCLRDHGLDVKDYDPNDPNPFGELRDADPEKRQAAIEACDEYAPGGENGRGLSEKGKAQMLEYVECLREQGLDIGDPDPSTGLPPMEDLMKLRNGGQQTKDAQKACEDKAPTALSGRAQ
jgi:hypothetical protein